MGSLAQLRRFIVLFSAGLLFVVSMVFGNDRKPGIIDGTAKSIGERVNSSSSASDASTQPYDIALTQTKPKSSNRWFAKDESAADASESSTVQDSSDDTPALPPDSMEIHK